MEDMKMDEKKIKVELTIKQLRKIYGTFDYCYSDEMSELDNDSDYNECCDHEELLLAQEIMTLIEQLLDEENN